MSERERDREPEVAGRTSRAPASTPSTPSRRGALPLAGKEDAGSSGDPAGSGGLDAARADLARYGGLGLQMAASVGVLAWLGWRLDLYCGTKPLFLLLGVLAGFVGGFLSLLAKVPTTGSGNRRRRSSRTEDTRRAPGRERE